MTDKKVEWEIIGPEIKNDMFYNIILNLTKSLHIETFLEIGASSGEGSTEAILLGCKGKSTKVFSIEVCTERYNILKERYKDVDNFFPYNVSSVSLADFPTKEEIVNFMNVVPNTTIRAYPATTVLEWYDKDKEYIEKNGIPEDGISLIKKLHGITTFDAVLIDGSEFTGRAEFEKIYGAKFILLDDTCAYKNWHVNAWLRVDPNYRLMIENTFIRNGFSIYRRVY